MAANADEAAATAKTVTLNGTEYPCLVEGEPECDVVVLGTGLKEMILTGVFQHKGLKVLVLDRNGYYGGSTASMNLEQIFEKFRGEKYDREAYKAKTGNDLGASRDYMLDLIPKYIMGAGKLVSVLVGTRADQYMEFRAIDGSYVFRKETGQVLKVPSTPGEATTTPLVGMFQKFYLRQFLSFLISCKEDDKSTHKGYDLWKITIGKLFYEYSLDENTADFVAHSMMLYQDEEYKNRPAIEGIRAGKLYAQSVLRFGKQSPFLYPCWGLSMMPEAFSRMGAIRGSQFMLGTDPTEIVFNESGEACGVVAPEYDPEAIFKAKQAAEEDGKGDGAAAAAAAAKDVKLAAVKCKMIVGDPTYFTGAATKAKIAPAGRVARAICILKAMPPGVDATKVTSCQIIIPQKQCIVKRNSDIFISVLSYSHQVTPKHKVVAIVSTRVETDDYHKELDAGIRILGKVVERFDYVEDCYVPTNGGGEKDKCYITSSYDASSHFETTTADVLDIYKRVMGEDLDVEGMQKAAAAEQQGK